MNREPQKADFSRRLKRTALVTLVLLAALLLQYIPTGYLAVYPGPCSSLGEIVEVEGHPARESSFYMVSILAKDASIYAVVRALIDPSVTLWSKNQVLGSMTPEEYMAENRRLMEESQRISAYVAMRARGLVSSREDTLPINVSIKTGEVAGPSAGLVFALEILSRIDGDLVMGRKIAGTGVLDETGKVLPVGGVAQKVIACRRQGVDIFLVPKANLEEALKFAGKMRIIGVGTFDEAVLALSSGKSPGR
ncbi:MAG: hypothetical protein IMF26_10110 [Candidatus Fermentithermobacillus carboniphilus]|uniref:Lon proteolytic domain-containing protein n=1 Tax=Candidatus Fermentithermobacillus carboniphilus TaxID=3085328 RepID=A0AAT9LDY7_9FIRM|nr:MAG: hypothetical protein IMF26_10110 [Candidatus Fermentithermobacillus carboniphilus]